MNRRTFLRLGTLQCAALGIALPGQTFADQPAHWVQQARPMMGTFVSVAVYSVDENLSRKVIADCFEYLAKKIALISTWHVESASSKLNRVRRLSREECPATLWNLLERSALLENSTSGLFNPLLFSLTRLWREARLEKVAPDALSVRHALDAVKRSALRITPQAVEVKGQAGVEFGGIGKGFIADLALSYLRGRGVCQARVDCGGDLRFCGPGPWFVDIVHPRAERMLGTVQIEGSVGIATSGDYESSSQVEGMHIHHLLDVRNGLPTIANQSITVVASDACTADALATASFSLAPSDALRMFARFPGCEALIVDKYGEIHKSRGLSFSQRTTPKEI